MAISQADVEKLVTSITQSWTKAPDLPAALLKDGKFDAEWWSKQTLEDQKVLLARLEKIEHALADEPKDERLIMYRRPATNWTVLFLTFLSLVGTTSLLWVIAQQWEAATRGVSPTVVTDSVSPPDSGAALGATPSDSPPGRAVVSPEPARPGASRQRPDTVRRDSLETGAPAKGPTETALLLMIILMGALGGMIHLAASFAKYVGNRQLQQSWVIYYVLMPVEGAAVAPILYLLLRVGVLSPGTQPGSATSNLNVLALYGFAGLTGLFAKQAIEMLAEVFKTVFKKVDGKDPLEYDKPPGT